MPTVRDLVRAQRQETRGPAGSPLDSERLEPPGRHIVLTYPALLLPDPSPLEPGTTARPVAVCSYTGYLGSAWDDPATATSRCSLGALCSLP